MAAIDHTVIVFKNGEWLEEVDYESLPFEFGRDGNIHSVEMPTVRGLDLSGWCMTWDMGSIMTSIWDEIKWRRHEYNAWYEREGFSKLTRFNWWQIKCLFQWITRKLSDPVYEQEVGTWQNAVTEVYIYHEPMKESYVSFYRDKTTDDTYIVLGGYGHWGNVYTHFMHRGYGKEFERKMVQEAFDWCGKQVLGAIADHITGDYDAQEEVLKSLQMTFWEGYIGNGPDDVWRKPWWSLAKICRENPEWAPGQELRWVPGQEPVQEGTDAQ